MEFNYWKSSDLKKIAQGGEDALNIEWDDETKEILSSEAAGSPFLIQFYCYIACLKSVIPKRKKENDDVEEDIYIDKEKVIFVYINKSDFSVAMRRF